MYPYKINPFQDVYIVYLYSINKVYREPHFKARDILPICNRDNLHYVRFNRSYLYDLMCQSEYYYYDTYWRAIKIDITRKCSFMVRRRTCTGHVVLCELYSCYINRLHRSWKSFILYGYIHQQNTENIVSPAGIEPCPSDRDATVLPLRHADDNSAAWGVLPACFLKECESTSISLIL